MKSKFLDLLEESKLSDIYLDLSEFESKVADVISTGSISLDGCIGVGGIPRGKISVIYGAEGSGKSSLSFSVVKTAVQKNLRSLIIDVENMIDVDHAKSIIGDMSNVTIVQPDSAEDAFVTAEAGINSKEFDFIIFDSIGALAPEKEKKDNFEDANVALVPRMLSKFLRRAAYSIRENNIAFLFINQVRDNIGSYTGGYSMPGGHALKHYASLIIMLSKAEEIKQGAESIGIMVKYAIKKNKLAAPFKSGMFPFMFDGGIDYYRDLLDFAETIGVIRKAGPYLKFEDTTLGQGIVKSIEYLKTNPETLVKIQDLCYNRVTQES